MNRKFTTLFTIGIIFVLFTSQLNATSPQSENSTSEIDLSNIDLNSFSDGIENLPNNNNPDASAFANIGDMLSDNENDYAMKWDPWLSKAAIRDIATTDDGDYMALAGGYLNDYEVHLYRWNYDTGDYDHVSEVGGGLFSSDVTSVAFADTDHNQMLEIIAGSDDGHLYVFEQKHIFDPVTNTENLFELVWNSDRLGRISDVVIADTDGDAKDDIIVGTANTLRFYEYSAHSGYPYSQDHWIAYEEVFSQDVNAGIFITALEVADVNKNGLKEVIVGLENGHVEIFENDGSVLDVGYPYPIVNDNSYRSIWSTPRSYGRMVSDIASGDLDNDGYDEALLTIQGISSFVISSFGGTIGAYSLERGFEDWESAETNNYPLDYYADTMIASSNSQLATPNVYFDNNTHGEPLDRETYTYNISTFYNSHSVGAGDARITTFAGSSNDPAWATYDFGNHEEARGNGVPNIYDLLVTIEKGVNVIGLYPNSVSFSISQDGSNYYQIDFADIYWHYTSTNTPSYFEIDVDAIISQYDLDYYRYLKLNSTITVNVDSIRAEHVNNPTFDGRSVEIGKMQLSGDVTPQTYGFIGTSDGSILAIKYEPKPPFPPFVGAPTDVSKYSVVWDSWKAESWKLEKNLFGLEFINKPSKYPAWLEIDTFDNLNGGMSYTLENFYNYRYNNNFELITGGSTINMTIISGSGMQSDIVGHLDLDEMVFGRSELMMLDMPFFGADSLNDYISKNGGYYTASLVPIDDEYEKPHYDDALSGGVSVEPTINEERHAFWLMLGRWDGSIAEDGSPNTQNSEITMWYLTQYKNSERLDAVSAVIPEFCYTEIWDDPYTFLADATMDTSCSFFTPYFDTTSSEYITLESLEQTGTLASILKSSKWMPKVESVDIIGSSFEDYIITNGKLHLLQNNKFSTPFGGSSASGEFNMVYKANYFEDINNDIKNRIWTNANPVDYDGDDDYDLILGFARYSNASFGETHLGYGLTYFENVGSRSDPIWEERPDVMSNNDIPSNFAANLYTDPVLYSNEYQFPNGEIDPILGYHPKYKTQSFENAWLFMQKDISVEQMYEGNLGMFKSNFASDSSLIVSTYPDVKRLQLNFGSSDVQNFGYHVFETWSNKNPLSEWTLSITSSDLDNDGKNEVIIGDYDNNIYVFEHLRNNTYKPTYKTDDITRTEEVSDTPYGGENFEGIGDTFYQTHFQHVKLLISGIDLNKNGKLEFIAATDDQILVYEAIRTVAGRIVNDEYRMIAIIDIKSVPALSEYPYFPIISAISWSEDLTGDGRSELIVGVEKVLLIFEVQEISEIIGDIYDSNAFKLEEIFFKDSYTGRGLYDIPGNYRADQYASYFINQILVDDIDSNGRDDLIISGSDRTSPIWNGFISTTEWNGLAFQPSVNFRNIDDLTFNNPISDVDIDDADFDGNKEVIISHSKGVEIYEYTNNEMVSVEQLTSNPNLAQVSRSYEIFNEDPISYFDVARMPGGGLIRVTIVKDGNGIYNKYDLSFSESGENDGDGWTPIGSYVGFNVANNKGWEQPSILITPDGSIWVSWVSRIYDVGNDRDILSVVIDKVGSPFDPFEIPITVHAVETNSTSNLSPKLFSLQDISDVVGMAYYVQGSQSGKIVTMLLDDSGLYTLPVDTVTGYVMAGFDIISVDTDLGLVDPRVGIVWSGYPANQIITFDPKFDLYFTTFDMVGGSLAQNFVTATPQLAYSTQSNVYAPSLFQDLYTGDLVVVYETTVQKPFGNINAIWSNDRSETWQGEFDMGYPLGFDTEIFQAFAPAPLSGEIYSVRTNMGNTLLKSFSTMHPVINFDLDGDGFVLSYFFEFEFDDPLSMGLCDPNNLMYASFNPVENDGLQCWSGDRYGIASAHISSKIFYEYEISHSTMLEVGDTDRDGRHELILVENNQIKVYEIESTVQMSYTLKWASKQYDKRISDLIVSDTNNNGFPEIIVAIEGGTVNSYEVKSTYMPIVDEVLLTERSIAYTTTQNVDNSWVSSMISYDFNSDTVNDILYTTHSGDIVALDGNDPSIVLYNKQPYGFSNLDYYAHDLHMISEGSGTSFTLARAYRNDLNLYDITTFTSPKRKSYSDSITRIAIADITADGNDEILLGFQNGSLAMIDTDFNLLWTKQYHSLPINDIRFVLIDGSNIAFVISYENSYLQVVDQLGTQLWESTIDVTKSTLSPFANNRMGIADLNQDGVLDMIVGLHTSMAFDGSSGSLLWSTDIAINDASKYGAITRDPVIYDINDDGYPDVIQSLLVPKGSSAIVALNGNNGEILWETSLPVNPNLDYNLHYDLQLFQPLTGNKDVLVGVGGSLIAPTSLTNPTNFMIDPKSGMVIGNFNSGNYAGTAISIDYPNGVPMITIGTARGVLHQYTVHDGNEIAPSSPPNIPSLSMFGAIKSKYVETLSLDITDDGIDDVIAITENSITAFKGDEIINGVLAKIWELSHNYGDLEYKFLSNVYRPSVSKDSDYHIVLLFSSALIVIEPVGGKIDYTFEHEWELGHTIVANYNTDDSNEEVIFALQQPNGISLRMLDYTNSWNILEPDRISDHEDMIFEIADLDNNGIPELVTYATSMTDPLVGRYYIYDNRLPYFGEYWAASYGGSNDGLYKGYPVTKITVGSFDGTAGDDILLTFDPKEVSTSNGLTFSTKELHGHHLLMSSGTYLSGTDSYAINPYPGTTTRTQVINLNGDQYDDVLIETDRGDVVYLRPGISTDNRIDISSDSTDGTIIPINYQQTYSDVTCQEGVKGTIRVSSRTSLSCYDEIDRKFANPLWSIELETLQIQDISRATFEGPGTDDDYLITGINGKMFLLGDQLIKDLSIQIQIPFQLIVDSPLNESDVPNFDYNDIYAESQIQTSNLFQQISIYFVILRIITISIRKRRISKIKRKN